MRGLQFRRMGLKVLALVCAVVVWLVVVNVSDPVDTRTFSAIPVTIKNEKVLTDNNKVYQVLENSNTVTIIVEAPRSILTALTASDFQVTADLSNLTLENTVPLQVSAQRYASKIEEMNLSNAKLKLEIEECVTRQISVDVNVVGEEKEGFAVSEVKVAPSVVTVSGPASLMEDVAALQTDISVEDRNMNMSSTGKVVVCNKKGEVISNERIKLSDEDVVVDVSFLPTKVLPIKLASVGECAQGYQLVELTSDPETITVAGDADTLAGLTGIELPDSVLDINGASEDVTLEINLEEHLPDGVRILEKDKSVIKAKARIEKTVEKSFSVPAAQVQIQDIPANRSAKIATVNYVTVVVSGVKEKVDALTVEEIKVSVKVSERTVGLHQIKAEVTLPSGLELAQELSVPITIEDATPASVRSSLGN